MVAARTRLQAARLERNWKQSHVLAELRRLAQRYRFPIAEGASLKTMLSRWENGHSGVGSDYRRLFCGIYGKDDAELGFTDQQGVFLSDPAEELRQRLATAASVNPSLVRLLAAQTDQLRVMDRQFGALPLLDQMRAHVRHAEELLAHAVLSTQRQPLASVLSDAAALAEPFAQLVQELTLRTEFPVEGLTLADRIAHGAQPFRSWQRSVWPA